MEQQKKLVREAFETTIRLENIVAKGGFNRAVREASARSFVRLTRRQDVLDAMLKANGITSNSR